MKYFENILDNLQKCFIFKFKTRLFFEKLPFASIVQNIKAHKQTEYTQSWFVTLLCTLQKTTGNSHVEAEGNWQKQSKIKRRTKK